MDFANVPRDVAEMQPGLHEWEDLVELLAALGLIRQGQKASLARLETTAPDATQAVFSRALELRAAIREYLAALVAGREARPEWVEPINGLLRWTEGYDQLVLTPAESRRLSWRIKFVMRERRLEWLLAAIARSAAELIAEGPGAPVRKCANPACGLYFYDTSRTGRRRWCSMAVCGNRSKVAAHARRARGAHRQGTN